MFDLVFTGTQAVNQMGLFLGALVCLGLGGLLLGNALYWRVHARRAPGTIIGVIARNGMFTPVYRYTLPDGQTHEAKSDTSSGAVRRKETGRIVPLLISAHNPTEARPAGNYVFDALGLAPIVPGLWLAATALTAYPVTWATWVMAAAMLIYLAERGRRILIPKGRRLSIEEWRRQRGLGQANLDLSDVQPIEKLVSAADAPPAFTAQLQGARKARPIVGLFAVLLFAIGIYQTQDIARLEMSGLRTQGTVMRLKGEWNSGRNSQYSYFAIVRFRVDGNAAIEFKDSVGSNPPTHRPGDRVTVLYRADSPGRSVMIDRGLFWNWAMPAVIFLFAGVLAWLTALMRRPTHDTAGGLVGRRPAPAP